MSKNAAQNEVNRAIFYPSRYMTTPESGFVVAQCTMRDNLELVSPV